MEPGLGRHGEQSRQVRSLSNNQIAEEAEIASTTVRDYVGGLCRRLGAANRTQVVSLAIALGLVQPVHL